MSDSLLNLLEILDEVLEEQGLQEQASGGAPIIANMTEERLKSELITFINNTINKHYEGLIKRLNEQQLKPTLRGLGGNLSLLLQFEKSDDKKVVIDKYFDITKNKETKEWIAKRKVDDLWEGKEKNWNSIFTRFVHVYLGAISSSQKAIQTKVFQLFNSLIINGLISNAKKEGSFALSDEFVDSFVQNENLYRLLSRPRNEKLTLFSGTGADYQSLRFPLAKLVLQYLKSGKAYYTTLLKAVPGEIAKNFFQATEKEDSQVSKLENRYIMDDKLLEVFKKQLISGNLVNLIAVVLSATEVRKKNETLGNLLRLKISETIKEFAAVSPMIVRAKVLPYLASRGYENLIEELPELRAALKQEPSLTRPTIKTSGGELSSDFIDTVDFFMEGAKGFENRLKLYKQKIKMFSDDDIFKQEIAAINPIDFLNRVVFLDYFVEFSKGFSAPVAGYMFEYFLAGLFGGKPVGEERGVVDIKLDDKLISAKFLSPGSYIEQSYNNFKQFNEENPEKNVTYVVGRKKRGKIDTPSRNRALEQSVKPLEIVEVDLFKFQARFIELQKVKVRDKRLKKEKMKTKALFKINGEDAYFTKDGDKIIFDNIEDFVREPFSTIPIMSVSNGQLLSYREALKDKLKGSTDKLVKQKKNILNIVQAIFDNLKEGESSARKYVSSGDKEQGARATKKLDVSKKGIIALSGAADEYKLDSEPNDT